jgi:O-antigen/teichoic acid export membrane protein
MAALALNTVAVQEADLANDAAVPVEQVTCCMLAFGAVTILLGAFRRREFARGLFWVIVAIVSLALALTAKNDVKGAYAVALAVATYVGVQVGLSWTGRLRDEN